MVVLYADFEKLCQTENLFYIKILKQQASYAKNFNGFTNIRLKRDRKIHFEDDNNTFCVKDRKI